MTWQCDVQEMPYQASVASVRPVCPEKEAEWHSSKTLAFSQALLEQVEALCHASPWPRIARTLILSHTRTFWQIFAEWFCLAL